MELDYDNAKVTIPDGAITTNLQNGIWIVTGDSKPAGNHSDWLGYQAGDQGAGLISFTAVTPLINQDYPDAINTINSLELVELEGGYPYFDEDTYIGNIPSSIGDLSNLKFLSLDSNTYTNIPEEIGNLT